MFRLDYALILFNKRTMISLVIIFSITLIIIFIIRLSVRHTLTLCMDTKLHSTYDMVAKKEGSYSCQLVIIMHCFMRLLNDLQ